MIPLGSIVSLLKSKGLDIVVEGDGISIDRMAAIAPDVHRALCYYVGDDSSQLAGISESIVICKPSIVLDPKQRNTIIYTDHPQLCFYHASSLFEDPPDLGCHAQSVVDSAARLGRDVSIGPFCTIGECTIGDNAIIESGVRIHRGTVIGDNVRVQANTVLGAAGMMWAWDSTDHKVPCAQIGKVLIEDNVSIGSNITIVRGTFENKPTVIGRHTMLAHGTMIGHGSVIGASNHFANNVSVAGSVQTGKNCFFGSGAIVRPHVKLPDDTIVGAGAVVVKDVPEAGLTLIGNPARVLDTKKSSPSGVPPPFAS